MHEPASGLKEAEGNVIVSADERETHGSDVEHHQNSLALATREKIMDVLPNSSVVVAVV